MWWFPDRALAVLKDLCISFALVLAWAKLDGTITRSWCWVGAPVIFYVQFEFYDSARDALKNVHIGNGVARAMSDMFIPAVQMMFYLSVACHLMVFLDGDTNWLIGNPAYWVGFFGVYNVLNGVRQTRFFDPLILRILCMGVFAEDVLNVLSSFSDGIVYMLVGLRLHSGYSQYYDALFPAAVLSVSKDVLVLAANASTRNHFKVAIKTLANMFLWLGYVQAGLYLDGAMSYHAAIVLLLAASVARVVESVYEYWAMNNAMAEMCNHSCQMHVCEPVN